MEHFINIESNVVKRRKTTSALRCGCTLFSHYVGRRRRPRLFSHPLLGEARIMAAHARQGKVMQGKARQRNATLRIVAALRPGHGQPAYPDPSRDLTLAPNKPTRRALFSITAVITRLLICWHGGDVRGSSGHLFIYPAGGADRGTPGG